MKKLLTLILAVLMVLAIVACGGGGASNDPPQNNDPVTTPNNNDPGGSTGGDNPGDGGDTNTPELPPAASDPKITVKNNAGSTFHLLTIQLTFGQYNTSESYDIIEDGVTVTFDLFDEKWERNYMLGALEMDGGFPVHEYMLPDGIPVGSTIILLANNEFSIVDPDGNVSN
ncbi:MAG: hypothetical protein FWD44_06020 [Oscillospiraceae bacterium]|nr:hypothetical protein [Oscillospiraceae bacterium]